MSETFDGKNQFVVEVCASLPAAQEPKPMLLLLSIRMPLLLECEGCGYFTMMLYLSLQDVLKEIKAKKDDHRKDDR